MYIVSTPRPTVRLIGRNGEVYHYRNLEDLAKSLIDGRYYTHGGVYGLHTAIVDRFSTYVDAITGQRHLDGHYVVETADGRRLPREVVAQACVDYRVAHRRRPAAGRGWRNKPRRSKVVTQFDRRHAEQARQDLAELDPRFLRIVEADCAICDPYEAAPRRTPQRSWKTHRSHQYRPG